LQKSGTKDGKFCVNIEYKYSVESHEPTFSFKFTIQEEILTMAGQKGASGEISEAAQEFIHRTP
jgi:hypothetical protein